MYLAVMVSVLRSAGTTDDWNVVVHDAEFAVAPDNVQVCGVKRPLWVGFVQATLPSGTLWLPDSLSVTVAVQSVLCVGTMTVRVQTTSTVVGRRETFNV